MNNYEYPEPMPKPRRGEWISMRELAKKTLREIVGAALVNGQAVPQSVIEKLSEDETA